MTLNPIRNIRNRHFFIGDILLLVIAVIGSYVLRLELDSGFYIYLPSAYWMIGVSLIIKPAVYYYFGLYRHLWLYAGTQEIRLIAAAVSTASILVSFVMIILFTLGAFTGFPRSVLIIDGVLSLLLVGGLRFTLRLLAESKKSTAVPPFSGKTQNVLIIGAGDAGALVIRELQKNPQLQITPVGILDDNPSKQNQQIHGIQVVGTLTDLAQVLETHSVDEVIIAIPSAPGRVVRLVADVCRLNDIPFRTMPGIYELLGGSVNISRLREVEITDLLRREPARVRDEQVGASLGNRTILVTGAGGSIGRELCRQISRWGPGELVLLGHGENSIFETYQIIKEHFPAQRVQPLIADVRDATRLDLIFSRFQPQIVYHAAAHKHVPLMEINVEEAVTNNILGTRNIVDTAASNHVERLVMISSDKAVRPANIMGASKRIAEMIVLDAGERHRSHCSFNIVRFGNVLGSRGSVVPLFKRQIARGGPVTVTHPDMRRYFMTIPEAVNLVLQASTLEGNGQAYVLNMGQQIRILDLAEDLIRLSGLEPGKDIEIVFTGTRPGEKLSEDLWEESYIIKPTEHPDIFRVDDQEVLSSGELLKLTDELIKLAYEGDTPAIMQLFDEMIPGAAVCSTPPLDMTSIG
jgi:FlaA1/EpsC-like NDP-sugar epimerase